MLSRALRLIRFPLMTVEEFAVGSAQSGILEDREVVELFLYFTVNPKVRLAKLIVCHVNTKSYILNLYILYVTGFHNAKRHILKTIFEI